MGAHVAVVGYEKTVVDKAKPILFTDTAQLECVAWTVDGVFEKVEIGNICSCIYQSYSKEP